MSLTWPAENNAIWQAAAMLLLEAADYAREFECEPWEFAVEIQDLRATGLTNSHLRWLVLKGIVDHAVETTQAVAGDRRTFRKVGRLSFSKRTCFVLRETGYSFANSVCSLPIQEPVRQGSVPSVNDPDASTVLPHWDPESRTLWFGSQVVKQFKVPAANQELFLAAFAEEGWPSRIDDPLPPVPGIDSKRRLHDTINRLNRHQKHGLIRFHANGNGLAVYWERVSEHWQPLPTVVCDLGISGPLSLDRHANRRTNGVTRVTGPRPSPPDVEGTHCLAQS